jgi:hypothetical protein
MLAVGRPFGAVCSIVRRSTIIRMFVVVRMPTTVQRWRIAVAVRISVTRVRVRIVSACARPVANVRTTAQQRVQQQ